LFNLDIWRGVEMATVSKTKHIPRPQKTKETQQDSSPSENGSFFKGDSILRVIGFIADMIAILSVLFAIKIEAVSNELPRILSPWILFPIWVMAAYTYICWLHSYWKKTTQDHSWSKRFRVFVVGDLLVRFRSPYLLIPAVLLATMFIVISKAAGILEGLLGASIIILFVTTAFISITEKWQDLKDIFISPNGEGNIEIVDSRWEELRYITEKKLERVVFIRCDAFRDLFYAWGIDKDSMQYAFAKYAAEHPGKMHFGDIRYNPTDKTMHNVLIRLEHLDRDKFTIIYN
jgi:hypothetical protein